MRSGNVKLAVQALMRLGFQDVDARDIIAFTRVFTALCADMTSQTLSTLVYAVYVLAKRRDWITDAHKVAVRTPL